MLLCTACSKDELPKDKDIDPPPQTGDEYVGDYNSFALKEEVGDFVFDKSITCCFRTEEGVSIKRSGMVYRRQDKSSLFILTQGLKEGKYRLLKLEFERTDPETGQNIPDNYGIGCLLNMENGNVSVLSSYTAKVGLYGSGTADDPYIITCSNHLSTIREIVNDEKRRGNFTAGCFFRQVCDIDMGGESRKCDSRLGWEAIGNTADTPFCCHYDGDGYVISNLNVKRDAAGGVGLFGFIHNAVIENVRITDSEFTGLYGVGAVAGMAVASGSRGGESVIRACSVSGTTIQTPVMGIGIGGILGAVDAHTRVWLDRCRVADGHISGSYSVGGILGGGYIHSKSIVTNCRNESADVTAQYTGAGGIVGAADTLLVASCENRARITGSSVNRQGTAGNGYFGTGGIAGGSGPSAFYGCTNEGSVEGTRGVGGILGSTLVGIRDDEYGSLYNFTFFSACENMGDISGDQYIGGICGEAEAGCYGSYNKGSVLGSNEASYAGGIVGAATVCAVHGTANFGTVIGKSYCGGIIARATFGSLAIDHNFGAINGNGKYVAGVVGLAGSSSVVHYCSNWGRIDASGTDSEDSIKTCAGIVGAIGETRSWTEGDVATCIFASAGTVAFPQFPVCGYLAEGAQGLSPAVGISDFGITAISELIDRSVAEFTLLSQVTGTADGGMIPTLKNQIQADMGRIDNALDSEVAERLHVVPILPILQGDCIREDYNRHQQQLADYYANSSGDYLNRTINQKRDERMSSPLASQQQPQQAEQNLVSGSVPICTAAGLQAAVTAASGPEGNSASPEAIVAELVTNGRVASLIGGANSLWLVCSDFTENTAIVSQCVNGGDIIAHSGGGVVGRLEEECKLNDCLNLGACSQFRNNTGALAAFTGWSCDIEYNLNLNESWYEAIGNPFGIMKPDVHYNYSVYVFSSPDRAHRLMYFEVKTEDTYTNWDFDRRWQLPVYPVNVCFPVPSLSEMSDQTN